MHSPQRRLVRRMLPMVAWGTITLVAGLHSSRTLAQPSLSFWDHWGDGQAEVSAYDLTVPRYGELRRGTAVAVVVTEPFSDSERVKADPGRHPAADEHQVLKLNLMFDFQTGVYDYHTMTSTFVLLGNRGSRAAGTATKVSFSSQEWCGQVWHQLRFDEDNVREQIHSYFDGEADLSRTFPRQTKGISEDALWLWARGLAAPFLPENGATVRVPFLPSLFSSRLQHRVLDWQDVTLVASTTLETVSVPAGDFSVWRRTATSADGVRRTFLVERAAPHRVISYEDSLGGRAVLRGVERMKYWERNRRGDERLLEHLGLRGPAPGLSP
ncbi:MAG: hypothetical protein ACO3JL_10730 [Myxococcota bacterium]